MDAWTWTGGFYVDWIGWRRGIRFNFNLGLETTALLLDGE
jgi:hypothetical protein